MIDYFKQFFKFTILFNALALAVAYGIEYFLNIGICQLCYYQRYIFIAIIVIAILAVLAKFTRKIAGVLIVLLYLGNASMALTQVLMEEGYISPSASCTGLIPTGDMDLEIYKAKVLNNSFVPCDIVTVRFLHISIAGFSFIISASMFFFSLVFVCVLTLFGFKDDETTLHHE